MADLINAAINANPTTALDAALDSINANLAAAGFQGWTAQDASTAVLVLDAVAQLYADLANVAGTVPLAILRAFGTQLFGLRYQNPQNATVIATFTFTSPAPVDGYLLEAGLTVLVDGQAFYLQNDVSAAEAATSVQGTLQASSAGVAYNGLGGVNVGAPRVELNDTIDWIANVTTSGVTSNGADQESDTDFEKQIVAEIALQAPRPLVAPDFANMLLSDIAQQATSVKVGRATSIDGYYPAPRSLGIGGTGPASLTASASLTNGSPTITSLVVDQTARGAIPAVGATVTGTGVPSSTTVLASPAPTSSGFTMSHNATTTGTETLTISAWTSVPLANTSFVTDASGQAFTAAELDTLQAYLQGKQAQNWLTYVVSPSYTTIYVTGQVHPLPGYDPDSVAASAAQAAANYLNPATWGAATFTQTSGWLNSVDGFNVVRFYKLLGVIEATTGVDYVPTGGLAIGTSPSPAGTSDLILLGPAPLPLSDLNTPTIVITAV